MSTKQPAPMPTNPVNRTKALSLYNAKPTASNVKSSRILKIADDGIKSPVSTSTVFFKKTKEAKN